MGSRLVAWFKANWSLLALVAASIALLIGCVVLVGASPVHAAADIYRSSFGKASAVTRTLGEYTPLFIAGLAVFVALKAGLFNIGVEGQFTVGALVSVVVVLAVTGSQHMSFGGDIRSTPNGLVVDRIVAGSPAARAGLKAGDILSKVDDSPVTSLDNLRKVIGKEAELKVIREGNEVVTRIQIEMEPRAISVIAILSGLIAGAFAGAIWGLIPGLIKAYRGGHEVITTIMLNWVAFYWATALVAGPLKDPIEQTPVTRELPATASLPPMVSAGDLRINLSIPIGLVLLGIVWYWLQRTVSGYELRAVGANSTAARFAGIDSRRVLVKAMSISGGIAGLAGAIQVLAIENQHYFRPDMSSGYGFDSLGVALLASGSAFGLIPSALLFAVLRQSSTTLQTMDHIPKGVTNIILGLIIIIAAAIRYRNARRSDG